MLIQKRTVFAAIVCFLVSLAPAALAWDSTGHEQIADIAWTKLSPHAKAEIGTILQAGDPSFRPADSSDASVRAAFDLASTFPDYIKRHRDTVYESIITTLNLKWQPNLDPNTSDREAFFCKTWHYYDTPIRAKGPVPAIKDSNALNAMTYATQQLAALQSSAAPDRKMEAWWLTWVEHLTGDLHQPLHCVSSYEFSPKGDAGGNGFALGLENPNYPGETYNLHAYWDEGIDHAVAADKAAGLSDTPADVTKRWTADAALTPSATQIVSLNPGTWIAEGATLADTVVYHHIAVKGVPSDAYKKAQVDLCKKQTVLAGYRLAAILNADFGG